MQSLGYEKFSIFERYPILIFWETTRACPLRCIHCRASAIDKPLPGELTTEEGKRLIQQLLDFDKKPTLIFSGGDPLFRRDLFELLSYANKLGINFGVAPAVSEFLDKHILKKIKDFGASSISFSLDGSTSATHDFIRRKIGTFERTIHAVQTALELGLDVQINTTVMKTNYLELPSIFSLIRKMNVQVWEVFFLIKTGRGMDVEDLNAIECESVCNFLYDASFYGVKIRVVEGPFIRRVLKQRAELGDYWKDEVYLKLRNELFLNNGKGSTTSTLSHRGTLDGDGILFVAYDGSVYPGPLIPFCIGNVKENKLAEIYNHNPLLKKIRNREL